MKILLIILAAVYAISPFDIVPEFLLGWVGWLDDIVLLLLLWRFFNTIAERNRSRRPRTEKTEGANDRTGHRRQAGGEAGGDSTQPKSPHQVLGVPPGASAEEIKRAYLRLANQYHPDKVQHLGEEFRALAEDRFKEIQAAYQKLRRP